MSVNCLGWEDNTHPVVYVLRRKKCITRHGAGEVGMKGGLYRASLSWSLGRLACNLKHNSTILKSVQRSAGLEKAVPIKLYEAWVLFCLCLYPLGEYLA
jgi:hypothetical protein